MHARFVQILTLLVWAMSVTASEFCSDPAKPTGLHFVDKYPDQPVVKIESHFFILSCCTGDWASVNISWFELDKVTGQWKPAEFDMYRKLRDHQQVLEFSNADAEMDSGVYMCRASEGQSSINRTFDVLIVDCDMDPIEIKVTMPEGTAIQASVGEEFSMDCKGNFGCYGALPNDTMAQWSFLDEHGCAHNLSEEPGRYKIKDGFSWDETSKWSTLTFTVTEEDLRRSFVCRLHKDGLPPAGFIITLTKRVEILLRTVVPSVVLPVVAILVVGGLIRAFCFPYAVFKWKSVTKKLPQRRPGHIHDAMLVYDEEGEEIATELGKGLQHRRYKVYMPEAQHGIMDHIDATVNCTTIIFVLSSYRPEGDTADNKEIISGFSNFFDACISDSSEIVFVHAEALRESEWKMLCQTYEKVYKHIPKFYCMAKWPARGNKLTWINFWSKVQTSLPRPRAEESEGETSSLFLSV